MPLAVNYSDEFDICNPLKSNKIIFLKRKLIHGENIKHQK